MLQWHIETDIFALLIAVVIRLSIRRTFDRKRNRDMRFLACIWIDIAALIVDIAASCVFDIKVGATVFNFAQTIYHIMNVFVLMSWFHYALAVIFEDKPALLKKADEFSGALLCIYIVFVLSNLFTGHIYTYSDMLGYSRGALFFVPVGIFALYAVFALLFTIIRGRRIADRQMRIVLMIVPIVFGLGIALQLLNEGWLVIFPFYTSGLLVVFLTIQQSRAAIAFRDLATAAEFDALTGTNNRDYAQIRITESLNQGTAGECAVMMLDIDNFKTVNDSFGHDAGDMLLKRAGHMITALVSKDEVVARYGGDEFLIFMPDAGEPGLLARRAAMLVRKLREIKNDDFPGMSVTCSIGCACEKRKDASLSSLLCKADAALFSVKKNGKNSYALYEPVMLETEYAHTTVDAPMKVGSEVDWLDEGERTRLLNVLLCYMPYIASINLLENSYYAIKNVKNMTDSFPSCGSFETLVEMAAPMFQPDDAGALRECFSRKKLIEAQRSGQTRVFHEARYMTSAGTYHWIRLACVFEYVGDEDEQRVYLMARRCDEPNPAE